MGVEEGLLDGEEAGDDFLAGPVAAGVEAVVVEEVDGDAGAAQEVEAAGVEVGFAEEVDGLDVVDGDGAFGERGTGLVGAFVEVELGELIVEVFEQTAGMEGGVFEFGRRVVVVGIGVLAQVERVLVALEAPARKDVVGSFHGGKP